MDNSNVISKHKVTVKNFNYQNDEHKFTALPDGYRQFGPIDLKLNGGILISTGSFTQVQIWMEPTTVHFSPTATVILPGPNPVTQPKSTFTYPNAPQFDLVISQCEEMPKQGGQASVTYEAMAVSATSESTAQTINLDPARKNLFIAFNDLVGAYGDNSGQPLVNVKLIK